MNKMLILSCVTLLGFSVSAIGQSEENPQMQEALNALGVLMSGGASNQAAISQGQLKALLPAEFEGMKRTGSEAGKNAAMGINITYATATYSLDSASIDVKISDISSMGQFMKMAQFAWTQNEMERETDRGYERTTKIDGHAAQESYTTSNKSGEIKVMVDGRFMVEVNGDGIEMEKLHSLLKAIDLNKLAALKPETATKP